METFTPSNKSTQNCFIGPVSIDPLCFFLALFRDLKKTSLLLQNLIFGLNGGVFVLFVEELVCRHSWSATLNSIRASLSYHRELCQHIKSNNRTSLEMRRLETEHKSWQVRPFAAHAQNHARCSTHLAPVNHTAGGAARLCTFNFVSFKGARFLASDTIKLLFFLKRFGLTEAFDLS